VKLSPLGDLSGQWYPLELPQVKLTLAADLVASGSSHSSELPENLGP